MLQQQSSRSGQRVAAPVSRRQAVPARRQVQPSPAQQAQQQAQQAADYAAYKEKQRRLQVEAQLMLIPGQRQAKSEGYQSSEDDNAMSEDEDVPDLIIGVDSDEDEDYKDEDDEDDDMPGVGDEDGEDSGSDNDNVPSVPMTTAREMALAAEVEEELGSKEEDQVELGDEDTVLDGVSIHRDAIANGSFAVFTKGPLVEALRHPLFSALLAKRVQEVRTAHLMAGFRVLETKIVLNSVEVANGMLQTPDHAAYLAAQEINDILANMCGSDHGADGSQDRLFVSAQGTTVHRDGGSHKIRICIRLAVGVNGLPVCGSAGHLLLQDNITSTYAKIALSHGDVYFLATPPGGEKCIGATNRHQGVAQPVDGVTFVIDVRSGVARIPSLGAQQEAAAAIMAVLRSVEHQLGDVSLPQGGGPEPADLLSRAHSDADAGAASVARRREMTGCALPSIRGSKVERNPVTGKRAVKWDERFLEPQEAKPLMVQQHKEGSALGGLARGTPDALKLAGIAIAEKVDAAAAAGGPLTSRVAGTPYKDAYAGDIHAASDAASLMSKRRAVERKKSAAAAAAASAAGDAAAAAAALAAAPPLRINQKLDFFAGAEEVFTAVNEEGGQRRPFRAAALLRQHRNCPKEFAERLAVLASPKATTESDMQLYKAIHEQLRKQAGHQRERLKQRIQQNRRGQQQQQGKGKKQGKGK